MRLPMRVLRHAGGPASGPGIPETRFCGGNSAVASLVGQVLGVGEERQSPAVLGDSCVKPANE